MVSKLASYIGQWVLEWEFHSSLEILEGISDDKGPLEHQSQAGNLKMPTEGQIIAHANFTCPV